VPLRSIATWQSICLQSLNCTQSHQCSAVRISTAHTHAEDWVTCRCMPLTSAKRTFCRVVKPLLPLGISSSLQSSLNSASCHQHFNLHLICVGTCTTGQCHQVGATLARCDNKKNEHAVLLQLCINCWYTAGDIIRGTRIIFIWYLTAQQLHLHFAHAESLRCDEVHYLQRCIPYVWRVLATVLGLMLSHSRTLHMHKSLWLA
jgi:hypothetical protein